MMSHALCVLVTLLFCLLVAAHEVEPLVKFAGIPKASPHEPTEPLPEAPPDEPATGSSSSGDGTSNGKPGLGQYSDNKQAPFSETEEEGVDWKEFAEKVKDILEDIEDAIEDAANTEGTSSATSARGWTSTITSSAGTELDGALGGTAHATTITTSFDPSQPSEACEAWESLWNYCSGAQSGAACACYSGTFYVPDQWDLLASRCGRYSCTDSAKYPDENYCALSKTASDFTSYCSNLNSATSAKFAAVAATATSATPGSTTTSSSVAQTGSASAAAGDDGINIGLGAAALLCLLTAVYIA